MSLGRDSSLLVELVERLDLLLQLDLTFPVLDGVVQIEFRSSLKDFISGGGDFLPSCNDDGETWESGFDGFAFVVGEGTDFAG